MYPVCTAAQPNTAMKPTPLPGSRQPTSAAYRERYADDKGPIALEAWHEGREY